MIDIIKTLIIIISIIVIFLAVIIIPVSFLVKVQCENRYNDTEYNIFAGCKVMYQGEYIPENLYIRAFEQNLNINK